MTAPNISALTSIIGRTDGAPITTSLEDIVTCAAEKVCKINSIYVSNVDGTDNVEVDVGFYDSSETTTFYIIKTLVVPADATIDVLSKPIYLEEGDKIQALAGAASDAQIIVSYEIIDDAVS